MAFIRGARMLCCARICFLLLFFCTKMIRGAENVRCRSTKFGGVEQNFQLLSGKQNHSNSLDDGALAQCFMFWAISES